MRMPIISLILFTLAPVGLIVGAHVADVSPSRRGRSRFWLVSGLPTNQTELQAHAAFADFHP